MKKLISGILAIVFSSLVFSLTANATCTISGHVVRMFDTNAYTYAYMKTSSLSSVYYYTYTADFDMRNALRGCFTSKVKCTVRGSASVCPTTTPGRYMGTTQVLYTNP